MKTVQNLFKALIVTFTMFAFNASAFAEVCETFEGTFKKNTGIDYSSVPNVTDPLLSPTNYKMPELGLQHGANLIRMKLCRDSAASFSANSFRSFLDSKIQELWQGWRKGGYQDQTLWETLGNGYINFSITSGYRHDQIQNYLLNDMVQPSFKTEMVQFLTRARPHLAHVQVYDISSELIANDLLIMWDEKKGEVLTIFLEYVHS